MKQKEGFTLFELLIALFIGTLLIMAGAYTIRIGLFSLERDEAWFNESAKEKAAYDFFWQQASALLIQKVPQKKSGENEENKNLRYLNILSPSSTGDKKRENMLYKINFYLFF